MGFHAFVVFKLDDQRNQDFREDYLRSKEGFRMFISDSEEDIRLYHEVFWDICSQLVAGSVLFLQSYKCFQREAARLDGHGR